QQPGQNTRPWWKGTIGQVKGVEPPGRRLRGVGQAKWGAPLGRLLVDVGQAKDGSPPGRQ
ncbi:hypothetical protein Dimus_036701, partial [Dionaea muscipula]